MSVTTLGLDLGVTSVGWSLIKLTVNDIEQTLLAEIVASGVRIFPATTEGTKSTPKNWSRRTSRGARRLLRRKRERRTNLRELLTQHNLLPLFEADDSVEFDKLGDPFGLRVRGLEEKLDNFEIGRAIFHIAKRRGFLSNRKSGKSKDDGVVLGGIASLKEQLETKDFKTLGQFLNTQDKKRGRYTARDMVENEFEQFWSAQSKFNPEILTDVLKSKIKYIVFYQRPIKSQRGLIGKCGFEPDKKRCDLARQSAQRFRYWQDLNNLKIQDRKTLNWRELTLEEKLILAEKLEKTKEVKFESVPKLLKLRDDVRFNLSSGKEKMFGNKTAVAFRSVLKTAWDDLGEEKQERLVEEMFRIESEISLSKRLKEFWNLNDLQIEKLLKLSLEEGYSRCSLKAINKMLPLLKEGKRYDQAATEIYGDHRKIADSDAFEKLPLPPQDLRNPIVSKALHELRKVVNAIIREYGKPDEIRLEMARDLKMTVIQKERFQKQQNQNKKDNEDAEDFYQKKFGLENVSGLDKLKYRLWLESGEMCPYTGETIPPEMLLSDQIDIEHIIPYSRCFDDSYMNKTICLAGFNRDVKKNKTPFELFSGDEQKYFELIQRIEFFPIAKRKKFEMKDVDEVDWAGRLLSDTRFICRESRGYLRQLYPYSFDENKYVQVVAGGSTALLRHSWGLNSILAEGDVDLKNRTDHRHHAIDAIVIALTTRGLFQKISKLAGQNRDKMRRILKGMEMPWESFLDDVNESINSIVVSHAPIRRVRGELLAATAYGGTNDEGVYTTRKSVEYFTNQKQIEKIIDSGVKEIVKNRLEEFGGDAKKAYSTPLFHKDGKTKIETVRIYEKMSRETVVPIYDKYGKPYKYYALGGNHHVEIYENSDGDREAKLVPRFYAAKKILDAKKEGKSPSPIIGREDDDWRFLFSLCPNDYIEFLGDDGTLRIYRVQKMSIGPKVTARLLNDAGSDYISGVSLNIEGKNSFKKIIRKLQVSPLGHLDRAND